MEERFRTEVEVEIYDDKLLGENVEDVQKVLLIWYLDMDFRERGVKDIFPVVPEQTLELYYDVLDEDTDDFISKHKSVRISDVKVDLDGHHIDQGIVPWQLVYFKGTWTLVF